MAAAEQETATLVKEEETYVLLNQPGTMFLQDPLQFEEPSLHVKQDIDLKPEMDGSEVKGPVYPSSMNIKEEIENGMNQEGPVYPSSMNIKEEIENGMNQENCVKAEMESTVTPVLLPLLPKEEPFLEDPLHIENPGLRIKEDPELKMDVDGSEHNGYILAAMEQETARPMLIKEEETYFVLNEAGSVFLQDPLKVEELSLQVKQDQELKLEVDDSEQKILEDPLRIVDADLHIKRDPELKLDVDGSEHNVVALRSDASNNTRLLQSSSTCDVRCEETVRQGMSHSELDIGSQQSTHIAIFCEGEEEETEEGEEEEEEESLSAPKLKCSLREDKSQIFSCSFCLQSFSSKYRLIIHVFVHIDGVQPPKFVCKSCGEVFLSYFSLKKHLEISEADQDSSADKEETFDCIGQHGSIYLQDDQQDSVMDPTERQCSSNETWKSFTEKCNTHITTHNVEIRDRNDNNGTSDITRKANANNVPHHGKRSRKCDVCGKSFTYVSWLKKHTLICTGSHKCDVCGKSFTYLSSLKKHALIHMRSDNVPHLGKRSRKCDVCGRSFTYLTNLKKHALICTGSHKCDVCGKSFTCLSSLKKHALIHTGSLVHKCDICGRSFTFLGNLRTHSLIHTGTKSHKCDICGKSFTQLSHLKTHTLIHTGMKPHKCDICGRFFTFSGNLKTHSLTHTGTKRHKCDICGKSFTMSGSLKIHTLIHTGTKPHKCDICGKSFTDLGNLKKHALIHTGTKRYKCDICGKYFTQSGALKRHTLTHTGLKPYKCDICSKSFSDLSSLKSHTFIHSGTKPHKCNICGKSFTKRSNLKTHTLIHTRRKPHKCEVCGKCFTYASTLKNHALRHLT